MNALGTPQPTTKASRLGLRFSKATQLMFFKQWKVSSSGIMFALSGVLPGEICD